MTLLTLFHQGVSVVIPPPTTGTGWPTLTLREELVTCAVHELDAAVVEIEEPVVQMSVQRVDG